MFDQMIKRMKEIKKVAPRIANHVIGSGDFNRIQIMNCELTAKEIEAIEALDFVEKVKRHEYSDDFIILTC